MSSRAPSLAAALAFVLAGGAGAQTLSLNRTGSGARAAGMANAFVAVSDDGTAASWNPAGLAQLRQPEFSLVYVLGTLDARMTGFRSPDGLHAYSNAQSNTTDSAIDFGSGAVPFSLLGKPVTLQLGWHRLYQLTNTFRDDISRHLVADPGVAGPQVFLDSGSQGGIDITSLAGAVKLTSRMSLGGSVDLWRGDWTERVTLVETSAGPASDFVMVSASNRIRGHNAAVGLLLAYPAWNVGLVYHSPFWSSYRIHRESRSSRTPPRTLDGGDTPRFRFPRSMGAGVAWRPAPRWMVALDLNHDRWTELVVDRLPGQPGPRNFFDELPPELSGTRDTLAINLGAERLFVREGSVLPVRAGFAWEPQGGMDPATRDPVDYLVLAGGGGFNTNRLKFDAAVQYRWGGFRTSQVLSVGTALGERPGPDAVGRAHNHEWRVKVSVIYRLQDTERLRGLLRTIFG